MPGRANDAVGSRETRVGDEPIRGRGDRTSGEQRRVETGRIHRRVGIEPSTTGRVDRPDLLDQRGPMYPAQIGVGGPHRRHDLDRLVELGLPQTIERRPQAVGSFRMGRAGEMIRTAFVGHDQKHVAERSQHITGPAGRIVAPLMALQSLSFGGARFRAGSWRAREDLAYLVPMSPAHTLTGSALAEARATLQAQGFDEVVTAAVAPPERDAFLRDGFIDREMLHLLRHELEDLPRQTTRWRKRTTVEISRAARAERGAILDLDARTFDDFWHLDNDGLEDAMAATPVSRLRVVRDQTAERSIIGYAVAGRAGPQGFLQRLAVDPDHQGAGLGSALVHDALHWMRRRGARVAWVNTQEANGRALALYEHLGFHPAEHHLTVLARSLT